MGKIIAVVGVMALVGLSIALIVVGVNDKSSSEKPKIEVRATPTRPPTPIVNKDDQCLKDAQCASERRDWLRAAVGPCGRMIENQSAYDYKWTTGPGERFSGVEVQPSGQQIMYYGSNVRFQNAFGAWQRMNYTCLFDPIEKQVLYIKVTAF